MHRWIRIALGLLVFMLSSGQVLADNAERFFADAERFTVRIDTTIGRAFIEDSVGAFHGAGFVVDRKRQWAMTNAHVVGYSPSKLRVTFSDGTSTTARKVYVDPYIDAAIVRYEEPGKTVTQAELGCETRPGVGHPVGAFGHPFGLNFTGTRGVVSGRTGQRGSELLQLDAPINGGNSGGPIISMVTGEVIGISSSSIGDDDAQNTNFGVPIHHACRMLQLLAEGQDPSPPQLDVLFYQLIEDTGPLVVSRVFLSPSLIGLRSNDEILLANGRSISTESELVEALRGHLEDVRLTVKRDGDPITVQGRLAPFPRITERPAVQFAGILFAAAGYRDGRTLETGHDVMIHSIERGSDGSAAKLWLYDLIYNVNNVAVRDLDHLHSLLQEAAASDRVQLDFLRVVEDEETRQMFESVRRNFRDQAPPVALNF